ncbi:MAG: hypothetical protein JWP09_321 [Candidatus Taylorbacteria bacterium]|nr:hypothetical protein [Candidatus Taylorbacteria bacterium]
MKNQKIIGIISGAVFVLVSVVPAFAVDATVQASIKADKVQLKTDVSAQKDTLKADAKTDRTAVKADVQAKVDSMKIDVKAMQAAGATPEQIKAKIDAVRASNQADREAFRAQLDAKRKTMKDDITKEINAFKDGKKVKLSADAKVQVKQRLSTVFTKLNAAIGRIAGFDKKLSDEIASRKAKGLDTSSAEIALELARRSLEVTKVDVSSVNAAVTASVDATTSGSKEAIKSVINTALESIQTTKSKYQDVLTALPKVDADANVAATTTVQTK